MFFACNTAQGRYIDCMETAKAKEWREKMDKNVKISGRILVLMGEYMRGTNASRDVALRWAFDQVLGHGAFACLASDLHDELTAS